MRSLAFSPIRDAVAGGIIFVAMAFAPVAQAAVDISSQPTKNMSCSAGVCAPTAKSAVLNVDHLVRLLKTSDVKVLTGNGAITIEVTAPLTWATTSRLTLDANCNVSIKAPVTVAGTGAMTIVSNDGGSGCDLLFFPGGKIDFWDLRSSLIVNGTAFTLVGDIKTLADDIAVNPSGFFALSADYDAKNDGAYKTSPIPTALAGTFEGLGHSIANFSAAGKKAAHGYLGLFANIGIAGVVRDLSLTNAQLTCISHTSLGAIAAESAGTIQYAFVSGTLFGSHERGTDAEYVGGLVGINDGTIVHSASQASVAAADRSAAGGIAGSNHGTVVQAAAVGSVFTGRASWGGGLVGYNTGTVSQSAASASVKSYGAEGGSGRNGYTGGLVGYNDGQILRSKAAGTVDGGSGNEGTFLTNFAFAGGLVGSNRKIVDKSFAAGTVTIVTIGYVGGVAGENDNAVTNSYSLTPVSSSGADTGPGGLVGLNRGTLASVYSTGAVSGGDNNGDYGCIAGGLIGCDGAPAGSIVDGYWDLNTSDIGDPSRGAGSPPNDPGITGLTDVQLKSELPAGFDPAIWGQDANVNNGYPYLLANPPSN